MTRIWRERQNHRGSKRHSGASRDPQDYGDLHRDHRGHHRDHHRGHHRDHTGDLGHRDHGGYWSKDRHRDHTDSRLPRPVWVLQRLARMIQGPS